MHIKFNVAAEYLSTSIREKEDGQRYAVLKVTYSCKGRDLEASLMCFSDSIWNELKEHCVYNFSGIVVAQKGNTFLSITKAEFKYDIIPY